MREAARVRIEGTRIGMERIGLELGIARGTLYGWRKRFGWRRPPPAGADGPRYYRSRRFPRPYGGDAVGTARNLVLASDWSLARIAARAGVCPSTVWTWMTRRGWTRPPAAPGSRRERAERRSAATVRTGDRRKRAYPECVVASARELYESTELSTRLIAARVKASRDTVIRWARLCGWTRPRDQPDPYGRTRRRRGRPPVGPSA